jgi:hypothetical protein
MTIAISTRPRKVWTAIERALAESFVAAPEEIDERVLDGAAMLDEHHPGWAAKIDVDKLCLKDCSSCVLGQVYGDYEDGLQILGRGNQYDLGFNMRNGEDEEGWALLQRHWEREIRSRQQ